MSNFGSALRNKILKMAQAQKSEETKKSNQKHSKRLLHVSDLNHTFDTYLPFNNLHINSDYLLIKETQTLNNKAYEQLAVEPIYSEGDKLRNSTPGKPLNLQISRDQHPFSHHAITIPECHQYIMYQDYKKRTRGYG